MNASDLTEQALRQLAQVDHPPCVSIYVPVGADGTQRQQDRTRLKNQIKAAENALQERNISASEVDELLKPIQSLLQTRMPTGRGAAGLALLRSPNSFEVFESPVSLPEVTVVSDRFYVKPLLPLVNLNRPYRVLALCQNEARVYAGDRYTFQPLSVPDLPTSLSEALRDDDDTDNETLQFHSGAQPSNDERAAMFHGQVVGDEDGKERVLRYCQMVDNAIDGYFSDQDPPLILAASEPLPGLYRQANSYRNLHPEIIPGDPTLRSESELHTLAWDTVAPETRSRQADALETLHAGLSKSRGTTDLDELLEAAREGRVDTVFVSFNEADLSSSEQHGAIKRPDSATEERINRALLDTLQNGGAARAVARRQMPAEADVAAVYRY